MAVLSSRGKPKKSSSYWEFEANTRKKAMGWRRDANIMHTSLQGQKDIYCYFEKGIEQQSLINQCRAKHSVTFFVQK